MRHWDLLTDSYRHRLWQQRDPRVPPGWEPPTTGGDPRLRPWERLSAVTQRRLYAAGSDRVPPGYTPPPIENSIDGQRPWALLRPSEQRALYHSGSPRVPEGYVPPPQQTIGYRRRKVVPPKPNSDWGYPPVVVIDIRTLPPDISTDDLWSMLAAGWAYSHIVPQRLRFVSGEVLITEIPNPAAATKDQEMNTNLSNCNLPPCTDCD